MYDVDHHILARGVAQMHHALTEVALVHRTPRDEHLCSREVPRSDRANQRRVAIRLFCGGRGAAFEQLLQDRDVPFRRGAMQRRPARLVHDGPEVSVSIEQGRDRLGMAGRCRQHQCRLPHGISRLSAGARQEEGPEGHQMLLLGRVPEQPHLRLLAEHCRISQRCDKFLCDGKMAATHGVLQGRPVQEVYTGLLFRVALHVWVRCPCQKLANSVELAADHSNREHRAGAHIFEAPDH
mmetsp:Transcript_109879/g.309911  ORF Transcript_109879/g.309911 Transcript_109879/m.309911 type:complete len:238 (-) Transcript_109879:799-1512(-)